MFWNSTTHNHGWIEAGQARERTPSTPSPDTDDMTGETEGVTALLDTQCFKGSDKKVIHGIIVEKTDGAKAKMKNSPVVRYLCLSAKKKRQKSSVFLKFKIHKVKKDHFGKFQIKKTWEIQELSKIEASNSRLSNGLDFGLYLDNKQKVFAAKSLTDRNEFLWKIVEHYESVCKRTPTMVGFERLELQLSGTSQLGNEELFLVEDGDELEESFGYSSRDRSKPFKSKGGKRLLTESEELAMEELLAQSSLGVGDADEFAAHLSKQLMALEAANIHAILASEEAVKGVVSKMDIVSNELTKMETWLSQYDEKVDSLKRDMEMIESKHEKLNIQSENQHSLSQTLGELIKMLDMDPDNSLYGDLVLEPLETQDGLNKVRKAAQRLKDAIDLEFHEPLSSMKAVRSQKEQLETMKQEFCDRVVDFIKEVYVSQATRVLANELNENSARWSVAGTVEDVTQLTVSSHHRIYKSLLPYSNIIAVIADLSSGHIDKLRQQYEQSMAKTCEAQVESYFSVINQTIVRDDVDGRVGELWETNSHLQILGKVGNKALEKLHQISHKGKHYQHQQPPAPAPPQRGMAPPQKALPPVPGEASVEHASRVDLFTVDKAFEKALNDWLPVLQAEQDFVEEFFHYKESQRESDENEVVLLLSSLFQTVNTDLKNLINVADSTDPLLALDLLVQVDRHLDRYRSKSPFIFRLLTALQFNLKEFFKRYIESQTRELLKHKVGVKRCGVLPPFAKFPFLVSKLESSASASQRQIVDESYSQLIQSMLRWLDTLAASNPKYKDLVKIENLSHFIAQIEKRQNQVLQSKVADARQNLELHWTSYIEWMISYQFPEIHTFFTGVKGYLRNCPANEVQYQVSYSKAALKEVSSKFGASVEKGIKEMAKRIAKHFASSQSSLLAEGWNRLKINFTSEYSSWERILRECYPSEAMPVPVSRLDSMLSSVDL